MKRKLTMILMMLAVSIGFGLAGAQSANAAVGEKIAFHSTRDGNDEIYVMNADGSNPTNLTNNGAADVNPSFSPDGSKIAFVSDRDGGNPQIYVMNADGSNPTRLTNSGAGDFDLEPSFSPDGSKIAFRSNRNGNDEIYVMNSDGSNQTRLTIHVATDDEPSFSPDGSKIAFRSTRDGGNSEIYVMNADGSNPTRLTINTAFDIHPSWGAQADSDGDGIGDACENTAPSISATNLTRTASNPASNSPIATVNDAEDAENTLTVTATPASGSGVTLTGISTDSSGNVTANVAASCTATTSTFTLRVTDSGTLTATATLTVNVTPETTPPVITLNGANPLTVECAIGFTDPGATAMDNCSGARTVTATNNINGNVPGSYTITYSASDGNGNTATRTRTVNVVDTTAPLLTLKANIALWPPNHSYSTMTMAQMVQSVVDGCNNTLSIANVVIEKVTSDEPDNVAGDNDGITTNDIVIAADCKSVQLRSERNLTLNGRVYVVTLRVRDASGNTTRKDFKVSVPISQNGTAAVQGATAQTKTSVCP